MEKVFILRNFKPISVNDAYTIDRHKTTKTQNLLWIFKQKILQNNEHVLAIKKNFLEGENYLTAFYRYFIPRREFFTKEGHISKFTVDWSNVPKLLDDKLFVEILAIDDSQVQRGAVEKLPWEGRDWAMSVTIKVRPLDELLQRAALMLPEALK